MRLISFTFRGVTRRRALLIGQKQSSTLARILERVQDGTLSPLEAKTLIEEPNDKEILQSYADLDHERTKRSGFPEVVFAEGKTPEQVASILDSMAKHVAGNSSPGPHSAILATR